MNNQNPIYGTARVALFVDMMEIENYPIITDYTKENWYLSGLWINQQEKPPDYYILFGFFDTPQLAERFYSEYKKLHGVTE